MDARGKRLNWRQACELLGCKKSFFYALVRDGRLPAYRLDGCKRSLWVYEEDCLRLQNQIPQTESSPCS